MTKIAIINGKLILKDIIIDNGVILMKNNTIIDYGENSSVTIPLETKIINAEGNFVGPGFIDIHNHGGGGYWAYENPLEFAKSHLKYGTTGVLPTIPYILNRKDFYNGFKKIVEEMDGNKVYSNLILGIHLEGPFLNPNYGAITTSIRPVDKEEYRNLLMLGGDKIKIWTLAPEIEGQFEFIKEATASNNIVFSAGHSEATAETLDKFVPYGLNLACHCMNASGMTPKKTRFSGTREVGLDEAVLAHDDFTVEVIPDGAGIHVRPINLKLILKAKGLNQVIIITDAMKNAGLKNNKTLKLDKNQGFKDYDDLNFAENGGLNGSRLTMDKAVYNMMRHTSIDIISAFQMATYNPAKLLKIDDEIGSIGIGKKANLIIVDDKINIKSVIFMGKEVNLT